MSTILIRKRTWFMTALLVAVVPQYGSAVATSDEYMRYQQEMQQQYQQYETSLNSEFGNYLQQQWQEFSQFKAQQLYSEPKISNAPEARSRKADIAATAKPKQTTPAKLPATQPVAEPVTPKPNLAEQQPVAVKSAEPLIEEVVATPTKKQPPKEVATEPQVAVDAPKPIEKIPPLPPVEEQDSNVHEEAAATAPQNEEFNIKKLLDAVEMPWTTPKKAVPDDGGNMMLGFYGLNLQLQVDRRLFAVVAQQPLNNKTISRYWKELSEVDTAPLQQQLLQIRSQLHLNDWGYLLLVQHTAEKLFANTMQQRLFSWYLLVQSGYKVRVGYDANAVYILVHTNGSIYGLPYFDIAKARYYNISAQRDQKNRSTTNLFIYGKDFPGADKTVQLNLQRLPELPMQQQQLTLRFQYGDKEYQLPTRLNRNLQQFYDNYPLVSLDKLLLTPMEQVVDETLVAQLQQIIAGKEEHEAANILLRFVQTAFIYQRDEEQFGEERYLFAQQTVAYAASDCEDRAILFAYLVRKLMGLSVVAVQYPGHLATAVKFTKQIAGDSVQVGKDRYVICDPTYIRANAGEEMPQYKGKIEKIIQPAITG